MNRKRTTEEQEFAALNYAEEFEELKCIGRGNFGAAFLVKHKNPPSDAKEIYFIAKKIVYAQLSEKEKKIEALERREIKHQLAIAALLFIIVLQL